MKTKYKSKDKVKTELGKGIVVGGCEKYFGVLAMRYCIKLINCPVKFKDMQKKQGGLFFHISEMELLS
jgi:hypothetical protein